MTGRGDVTFRPGNHRRANRQRSLPRVPGRRVELPDGAARRARHRDDGPSDDRRARRSEPAIANPFNRLRRAGAGGRGRHRRDVAAERPLDVATHRVGAQSRRRRRPDAIPPEGIPDPDDCVSFRDPLPDGVEERGFPFNFWEHVEGRPALGHPPWEDYVPDRALRATWYRFDEPARLDNGRWDPLALVTMCDMMPGAVGEKLGPGDPDWDWYAPSTDLTVHVLNDARSEWVLAVNRARFAGDGYASADQELWDMHGPEPVLAAYGTQVMFFTVLGPPS
jgi:hypothetical protein